VVMQTADVWDWDDRAAGWRLGRPRDGSIFVEREVSAPVVVVVEVALEVAAQRAFVPHDDVIEALAPEGANHAFNERILPGRTRRRYGSSPANAGFPAAGFISRTPRSNQSTREPDERCRSRHLSPTGSLTSNLIKLGCGSGPIAQHFHADAP
jgi:hypothetical protein